MRSFIHYLSTRALNLLFPKRCVGCAMRDVWLCDECAAAIPAPEREYRGGALWHFSAFSYRAPAASRAIRLLKYRGATIVADTLARALYDRAADEISEWRMLVGNPRMVILPIPMSKKDLRSRGINHAEVLARAFGHIMNIPVESNILDKMKETPRQARSRSRDARMHNIRKSMRANNISHIAGSAILLFDDVYTTGATMEEAFRALRAGGFSGPIAAITIAH